MPGGIPSDILIAGPVVSGNSFYATVYLDGTVTVDTTINLNANTGSTLLTPLTGTFPLTPTVSAGHDSVDVYFEGINPGNVQLVACPAGEDITNSDNWTALRSFAIMASGGTGGGN